MESHTNSEHKIFHSKNLINTTFSLRRSETVVLETMASETNTYRELTKMAAL